MSLIQTKDYREFLENVFQRRRQTNSAYSLRAFARDLRMPPSSLSEVLARKHGLGPRRAVQTAHALGLNQWEREHFCDLVYTQHGKSPRLVKAAKDRIVKRKKRGQISELAVDRVRTIGRWYQVALSQMVRLQDFRPYVPWIALRLGIQPRTAKVALHKLIKYGFLREDSDGRLYSHDKTWQTAMEEVPDSALRDYHCELLDKAKTAVQQQGLSERHVVSMVLALKKSDVPQVKHRINEFIRELAEEYKDVEDPDSVYFVGTQACRLDREV